jgi:hypothetical protein
MLVVFLYKVQYSVVNDAAVADGDAVSVPVWNQKLILRHSYKWLF